MVVFVTGIALLTLIALLAVWLPVWRRNKNAVTQRDSRLKTNSAIYQYQLNAAAKQFCSDDPAFNALKNELALGLLTEEKALTQSEPAKKAPILLPIFMSFFVIALTVIGYGFLGSFNLVQQHSQKQVNDPLAELSTEEAADIRLANLFAKIRENPLDDESWFVLTEYYLYNNQFENALIALSRIKSINGETNEVLAAEAMILYYQNGQRIDPPIQRLLDRVLQDEPLHVTALMLMASDFYYRAQFQEAIDIWQRLLDSNNPQIDRIMLIERINIAKMMLNRQ